MGRLGPLLALLHPGPSLATVAVALACVPFLPLSPALPPLPTLLTLAVSLTFQQFAISLHNDYCDRRLDATAKPTRALPRGLVSARTVLAAALVSAGLSLLAALPLGLDEVFFVSLGLALGFIYNALVKRTFLSWIPFALAFPLIPLFGAAAVDSFFPSWPLFAFAIMPATVAVHLADSLPDIALDAQIGSRGLAARAGRRLTRFAAGAGILASSSFLALLVLADRPYDGPMMLPIVPPPDYGPALTLAGAAVVAAAVGLAFPRLHRAVTTLGAGLIGFGWLLAMRQLARCFGCL